MDTLAERLRQYEPLPDRKAPARVLPAATIAQIVDCTVEAFNAHYGSLATNKKTMDKDRLLAGDPVYKQITPYNRYYWMCVALAAKVDVDQAMAVFKLPEKEIDRIHSNVKVSLKSGNNDSWSALNAITTYADKEKALSLPEIAQKNEVAPQSSELSVHGQFSKANGAELRRRSVHEDSILPTRDMPRPKTLGEIRKSTSDAAADAARAAKPKKVVPKVKPPVAPKQDMNDAAGAASKTAAPKKNAAPHPGRKATSGAMNKAAATPDKKPTIKADTTYREISALTPHRIQDAMLKICDEAGIGYSTMGEVVHKGYVSAETRAVRGWIAFAYDRLLPSESYTARRNAGNANLSEFDAAKAIVIIRDQVKAKDPKAVKVLELMGERMPLSNHQKRLLAQPELPRFKSWMALGEIMAAEAAKSKKTVKAPAEPRNPEHP